MFDPMTLIFRGYGVVSWLPMLGLLECFLAALYFKDYSEKDALRAELDLFLAGIGALPFLLYGAVVLNLWSHGDSVKIPTNIWLWAVFAGVGFYYGAVKFRAEAQRTRDQADAQLPPWLAQRQPGPVVNMPGGVAFLGAAANTAVQTGSGSQTQTISKQRSGLSGAEVAALLAELRSNLETIELTDAERAFLAENIRKLTEQCQSKTPSKDAQASAYNRIVAVLQDAGESVLASGVHDLVTKIGAGLGIVLS